MKCRSLVRDNLTGKQNIVWFGSCGKNTDYILQTFTKFGEDHQPIIEENGTKKAWKNIYNNYYTFVNGPIQNVSNIWNENILYFKKSQDNTVYYPILIIPEDWNEKYNEYYIAEFAQNTNPVYDPDVQYFTHNNKVSAENYSTEQKGVRDSLIQRLSVIKGELWYKASYGLPLMEKIKNKGIYDTIIINIITTHPDVVNIVSYTSYVDEATRKYVFDFIVYTIFNEEVKIIYTI